MKNDYLKISLRFSLIVFILVTGCQAASAQTPGCHAKFLFSKAGNDITFQDSSWFDIGPQNTTWSWDFGDGDTCTLQNPPTHSYASSEGGYDACLTVTNCSTIGGLCCIDTYCEHISMINASTGIKGIASGSLSFVVSPNPATSHITISNSINSDSQVEIFNMLGETILKTMNKTTIDISALSKGVYFIKVKQGDYFHTQRFVKQ